MKKILIASLMLVAANAAFATTTGKDLAAGSNMVTMADCAAVSGSMLQQNVPLNLSAGNIGRVSCDDATANLGVAVANVNGKNNIYTASSAGGSVAPSTSPASPLTTTPTQANVTTAADASSAIASASGS